MQTLYMSLSANISLGLNSHARHRMHVHRLRPEPTGFCQHLRFAGHLTKIGPADASPPDRLIKLPPVAQLRGRSS